MRQRGEGAAPSLHVTLSSRPHVPQVVRAKERLDEELRIQSKDEKEKGWKAET